MRAKGPGYQIHRVDWLRGDGISDVFLRRVRLRRRVRHRRPDLPRRRSLSKACRLTSIRPKRHLRQAALRSFTRSPRRSLPQTCRLVGRRTSLRSSLSHVTSHFSSNPPWPILLQANNQLTRIFSALFFSSKLLDAGNSRPGGTMRAIKSFKWMLFSILTISIVIVSLSAEDSPRTPAPAQKIELCASRRQRKFFRCPQPHERGKAWSDETTGGFAGRTLRPK